MTGLPYKFDSSPCPFNDSFEQSSPKRSKLALPPPKPDARSSACGIPTTPIASPLRRLALRSWRKRSSRRVSPSSTPPGSPLSAISDFKLPERHFDSPESVFALSLAPTCWSPAPLHKISSVLADLNSDDNCSDTTLVSPSPSPSPLATRTAFFDDFTCIEPPVASSSHIHSVNIFEIPEIVHRILSIVDAQYTQVPREATPTRRCPQDASPVLAAATQLGLLHACLLVNKLFCSIAREIIHSKVLFASDSRLQAASVAFSSPEVCPPSSKPSMVVLHKLFRSKQEQLDSIAHTFDYSNLEWLELYMCPKLVPSPAMFAHGQLQKLVVTGSRLMDDSILAAIAKSSPKLTTIDLRACELVSDAGIYQVGKHCRNLTSVNFGRKSRGHLVTDASIVPLVAQNRKLQTIGLAGCHVSDRSIWALAASCGHALKRLSLNNCPLLSDRLIPALLLSSRYPLPRLCVLELRYNVQLTQLQPIIAFKRRQHLRGVQLLVELCPTLAERMTEEQRKVDARISRQIFRDILDWVNDPASDTDKPFAPLLAARTCPTPSNS